VKVFQKTFSVERKKANIQMNGY